jgi:DNA-binding NtrC family response regulator
MERMAGEAGIGTLVGEVDMTTRVLVVDDEEKITYLLQQGLQVGLPDCSVDVARSGQEALRSLAGRSHDLIITDFHMPGTVDGLALVEAVRNWDAEVPVILMTGYGSEALRAKAKRFGVNHYLEKPFDLDHLLTIAGELLAGRRKVNGSCDSASSRR